jgi:4-hydroxybenzoate polyprenyltransferase
MSSVSSIIRLLRPKQWSKNLLVIAAPIFAGQITHTKSVERMGIAFAAMCLMSSATYIFNDIRDAERDRLHPTKKGRPIASGAVPTVVAVILGGLMGVGALAIAQFFLNMSSLTLLLVYACMQVLYNLALKRVPIADVFTISVGFVIRAMLGATAVEVPVSAWFLFCTGALALMLGFAKRRQEFVAQGDDKTATRESLGGYSRPALDALVIMTATGAAICYGIYTVNSKTAEKFPSIIVTNLPVFYGIARYTLLVFNQDEGGEPADLMFSDFHLLGSVVVFLASSVLAVSGWRIPFLER